MATTTTTRFQSLEVRRRTSQAALKALDAHTDKYEEAETQDKDKQPAQCKDTQAEVEDDDDEEVEEHKSPDPMEDQQKQAKRPRPPQKQGMQQEEDAAQPLTAEQHIQRNMRILQAQQVTIHAALEEMRAMTV
jgi:hypothetical protein